MTFERRIAVCLTLGGLFAAACGGEVSQGGGSETGFLACDVDQQCPEGSRCLAGGCRKGEGTSRDGVGAAQVHDAGTAGESPDAEAAACANAVELPSSSDVWWDAEWSADLPHLPLPGCGTPNNPASAPAVVARWVAPADGHYYAYSWGRDFHGVFGGARECGQRDRSHDACNLFEPQWVPAPPLESTHFGGFNLYAEAGDVWYFTFQYLNLEGAPPPDHGTAVARIARL